MSPFLFIPMLTLFPIMTFLLQKKHLLMMLLSLEGMILTLALTMATVMLSMNPTSLFITLFLLALGACEAALGLSLLVIMSRSYGTDMVQSLSINKC
nr:NADH dehydrogenase subunit 4L [Pherusa bengalensis]